MRLIATVLAVGLLSACTQGYYVKHRSPISVSKHVKRLNTTDISAMGASNQPDSSAEQPKESWNINGNKNGTAEPERRIKILAAMPNRNVLVLKRDNGKMARSLPFA